MANAAKPHGRMNREVEPHPDEWGVQLRVVTTNLVGDAQPGVMSALVWIQVATHTPPLWTLHGRKTK